MTAAFIPYAKQSIGETDILAVQEALKGDLITRGIHVEAFERAVAQYCGALYAVAFSSGTAALMGAYFAAGLTRFDRVISTPNTFIATVGAPIQLGNYPHFIDIDRSTGNMNLEGIKETLDFRSTRGRLIITPVHFSGIAVDMKALSQILQGYSQSVVIEDAAHALGSCYRSGQKVGSCAWSDLTIFSFHPAKTITTGEGGMVTTNNPELYHRLQLYRNNGIEREAPYLTQGAAPGYYEVQAITGNFHFTDFQAALGLSQLQRLETFIQKRRALVKHYRSRLLDIPHMRLFTDQFDQQTAFHLFVVQIDFSKYKTTREQVMQQLQAKGIGSQVHYIPIYHHPVFLRQASELSAHFPEEETYYSQALSLPLYYDLKEEEVIYICEVLKSILNITND